MVKAFVSWSSGKESCLALYRAKKDYDVKYLFNMMSEDNKRSRSHNIAVELIRQQAQCLGIELVQKSASWADYEDVFKNLLKEKFFKEDILTGIFGDIDVQEHRAWVEKVCAFAGMKAVLPLWQQKRESLLKEFIGLGFKAVVVVVNSDYLSDRWLGREIDMSFMRDLKEQTTADVCGENGEYHTFVYDGPVFKKPVQFKRGKKIKNDNYWFLELKG
ncbi:MAG: diphthine--ammonia ligase [Candidatus Omnitrophica bacterium]|nr:diphthine--ammonia ligase [Candidatus Omnitrophota bacterium]